MLRKDEGAREVRLQVRGGHEEEQQSQHLSSEEEENFSRFEALKKKASTDDVSKPKQQKVPSTLSENRVVAIGPLHHDEPGLQGAEETKLKLAVQFTNDHRVSEQFLYKEIKKEIGDLRKCYRTEDVDKFKDQKLAWMFFVDGCAVLQVMQVILNNKAKAKVKEKATKAKAKAKEKAGGSTTKAKEKAGGSTTKAKEKASGSTTAVDNNNNNNNNNNNRIKVDFLAFAQRDLFMLENQLPFRVLHILRRSVNKEKEMRQAINKLLLDIDIDHGKDHIEQDGDIGDDDPPHLLGLLRERLLAKHSPPPAPTPNPTTTTTTTSVVRRMVGKSILPPAVRPWPETAYKNLKNKYSCSAVGIGKVLLSLGPRVPNKTFRSISELKEAGIRVIRSHTGSLRDVGFRVGFLGTLNIPLIVVDDSTASTFTNLVAYEMCPDFHNDFGVTSYVCFLDSLIDTARDVKELRHAGVLLNYMGSDEDVATLFNDITTDLVPNPEIYRQVMEDMGKYCDNPLTPSIAKMYHTHFSSPWSIVAFLGALMGLVFTTIQAYYAIQTHRRRNQN